MPEVLLQGQRQRQKLSEIQTSNLVTQTEDIDNQVPDMAISELLFPKPNKSSGGKIRKSSGRCGKILVQILG